MSEHLNAQTFDAFIATSEVPVLADFYQDGCVPCRRVAPLLSKAEVEYAGRLVMARVNTAQNMELAERYEIAAAPTLILFRDGRETARHWGVIDKDGLKALIESSL